MALPDLVLAMEKDEELAQRSVDLSRCPRICRCGYGKAVGLRNVLRLFVKCRISSYELGLRCNLSNIV